MVPSPFAVLSERVAVVTGSSSGIGRAIALELASAGARVVLHARQSREAAEQVAETIRQRGGSAEVLLADLGNADERESFAENAWNRFGHVDIWVNNAGADLLTGDARNLSYGDKLETLWNVDVAATVLLSKTIGQRMRERERGVIINIGWDQADRGMEGDSGELFSTSKNAIMGVSRSLAVSFAPQVRVHCVAPGWIKTAWGETAPPEWQQRVLDETPLKRWGTPEDIANVVRFLVSDEASYLTGQVINVNGGAIR